MKFSVFCAASALIGLLVSGCSTTASLEQELVTTDRESLENDKEVLLPSGYNKENFRSLKMGVAIEDIPLAEGQKAKPLPPFVKVKVEGDMVKLKRFTIVPVKDEGGKMFFADISDVDGNVRLKEQVKPNELDLVLTVMMQRSKRSENQGGGKYALFYIVDGQVTCRDMRTGTALFSETVNGMAKETQFYNARGQRSGGFDDTSVDAVNTALVRASKRALKVLFSKLGNMYPIGGEITKCDRYGEMLTLNKGTDDGIGAKGQQFTVVVDDEGQDVPLCYAEAQAGKTESILKPYRWNDTNRAARDLKKEFETNPRGFLKKYKVYAAGHGLSLPAEWDVDGEKSEVKTIMER